MASPVLELHLTVDEAHVVQAAAALQERLRPAQWKVLAQLAAEVVSRWESAAAGTRIVVVPALERGAELERALRLRPAGLE